MTPSRKPLRYAVIGAGNIFWTLHRKNLDLMEGTACVAVCDPSPESRQRAETELGVETFPDVGALVESGVAVDALLNFSPPFARKGAVEAAVRLQVPLFVEKPPAPSVAEGREIRELIDESGVPVSVGFMFRYMPAVDRMRELIGNQPITHVSSEYFCPALTDWKLPDWFLKKEISGGPIIDQAIHLFDLVRYLAGEITEVMSFGANVLRKKDERCTVEDSSSTLLRFANGVTGAHLHSWVHDTEGGLVTVRTEHAYLSLDMAGNLSGRVKGQPVAYEAPEAIGEMPFHYLEMAAFLEAVQQGDFSGVRSSYADALRSLEVSEAVNRSMETGQPITIRKA